MNFTGNLDILNTFSYQQLKTIEAALSSTLTSSPTIAAPPPPSTTASTCATTAAIASPIRPQAPPVNQLSPLASHQIDHAMNNLPKTIPPPAAVQPTTTPVGAVPVAPNQQLAEYLAMQQQAQQLHQQHTQQQNQNRAQSTAVPGSGPCPNNRPFSAMESPTKATPTPVPMPPLAVSSVGPIPAAAKIPTIQQTIQPELPPLLMVQQPAQQQFHKNEPLALTSHPSRPVPPLQPNKTPAGTVTTTTTPLVTGDPFIGTSGTSIVPPLSHNQNNATVGSAGVTAGTGSAPQLLTSTVKLSYQHKAENVPPPPLALSSKSLTAQQPVVVSKPPVAVPTVPQQPASTPKPDQAEKKSEATLKTVSAVTSPPSSSSTSNNNSKPVTKAAPPPTMTTPSKTSMKLATVTTPRIKQTARKNQNATQQHRSPTNLASISPAKDITSPVTPTKAPAPAPPPATVSEAITATTPQKSLPAQKTATGISGGGGGAPGARKSVVPLPVGKVAEVVTIPVATAPPAAVRPKKPRPTISNSGAEVVGSVSVEGKTKRNRIKTVPYQIPTPEMTLAQKLSIAANLESPVASKKQASGENRTDQRSSLASSGGEDKLILFYKNEFVAVRNAEDGFFLCQVLQNVFKSSPKIRIRWLSETKNARIYTPDFNDVTDLECILTNVDLEMAKGQYQLPKEELTRIQNILKKAMGLLAVSEITEDNPDGLDLSIYIDETQLERKEAKASNNKKAKKRELKDKVETPKRAQKSSPTNSKANGESDGTSPSSSSREIATRVSKRGRVLQSPNYKEDDEDDLPFAARTITSPKPKVAEVVKKTTVAKSVPSDATPQPPLKKKATLTTNKNEPPMATIVVAPKLESAPSPSPIKSMIKTEVGKPKPKSKGKEAQKPSPVQTKEKKPTGKRKLEPEPKTPVLEASPAKKAKAEVKPAPVVDDDESSEPLIKMVQSGSAAAKKAAKTASANNAGKSGAKKKADEISANQGKGRAGRGKK